MAAKTWFISPTMLCKIKPEPGIPSNLHIKLSLMIFNKVNRHELSMRFSWSVVTCSSAGSHGSSQLRFRVFVFMCSRSGLCLSSSRCWVFLSFITRGSHQTVTLGAATVCWPFPHPPGLRGFASHGSGILSRGSLATVEAPGYPRHPPST